MNKGFVRPILLIGGGLIWDISLLIMLFFSIDLSPILILASVGMFFGFRGIRRWQKKAYPSIAMTLLSHIIMLTFIILGICRIAVDNGMIPSWVFILVGVLFSALVAVYLFAIGGRESSQHLASSFTWLIAIPLVLSVLASIGNVWMLCGLPLGAIAVRLGFALRQPVPSAASV